MPFTSSILFCNPFFLVSLKDPSTTNTVIYRLLYAADVMLTVTVIVTRIGIIYAQCTESETQF